MARKTEGEEITMIKVKGNGGITAKIVADSISSVSGDRITTFELEYHRYVHAEMLTHRMFSRNAASSRAIPVKNMLELVRNSPAMPVHWGKNQAGMQAKEEITDPALKSKVIGFWKSAACFATKHSELLAEWGCHKQIVNRLVEPYQMIKVVVTATSFDNFFWLRFHEDAQPEIAELARCMLVAYKKSKPKPLSPGQWHLPYFGNGWWQEQHMDEDTTDLAETFTLEEALKISASCCAQVSYRKSDNSLEKAETVWERLVASQPVHASPTEHQATPMKDAEWEYNYSGCDMTDTPKGYTHVDKDNKFWSNNFKGWIQHRALIANNVCNSYDYSQDVDENGLEITDEEENV